MSLLDDLSQSSIGDLLGQYGPSLLTQPQMPQTTNASVAPPDAAALAAPMNANISVMPSGQNYPQMGEATLAQQLAHRAPTHPGGLQGFFSKALDALVPIPDAYKQMMSPADIKRLQMQGLQQIGAGLTGAYTGAGQRKDFGVDLGMGLNASRESTSTALQPLQEMLKTQGMGVGIENLMQRQQLMKALGQMGGQPADDDYEAQVQWHQRRASLASPIDPAIAHAETAQAQVAREMMKQDNAGGDAMELVKFGPYSTNYDKKAGLIRDPIPTSKTFGQMVTPDQLGEAPLTPDQRATLADVKQRMATQAEQYGTTRADKAVNTFQTTKENATAIASGDVAQKLNTAIGLLRTKNPQALADVPVLMARLVHEGGVGRLGIIKQMTGVDPSIPGAFEAWASKHINATMPAAQIDQLQQVVNAINADNRKLYEGNYNRFKKAFPDELYRLKDPDEAFGAGSAGTSGLQGTAKY